MEAHKISETKCMTDVVHMTLNKVHVRGHRNSIVVNDGHTLLIVEGQWHEIKYKRGKVVAECRVPWLQYRGDAGHDG